MKRAADFFNVWLLVWLLVGCSVLSGCVDKATSDSAAPADISIAFMPDIHFHDVYGRFADDAFVGLTTNTPTGEQQASIRSMRAQLHSTRLFNENYFAFIAALDDIVKRNIKYVALPGDFSDDGQPLHLRGLKTILDRYHRDYGLEFFVAPGNHDPTKPVSHPAGKMDFLGADGKEQPIFSHGHPVCLDLKKGKIPVDEKRHALICSDEVKELGYKPIMDLLGAHGFYPQASYRYFETPYSDYSYTDYRYSIALLQAQFARRHYEICHQGTGGKYKKKDYSDCYEVADTSYLVEPVDGVWLLAIDANVYQPKLNSNGDPQDAENFLGSGNAGYNRVISHKTQLLEWIKSVVARAQTQGKTLIAFSHFPMQDFYDGSAADIASLLGEASFQLARNPSTNTSKLLAETGLKIHVAGHMHINDTGVYRGENNRVLFNIQAPSLAAYLPAYKILKIKSAQSVEVETLVLNEVPRFNELFSHYRAEWNYLHRINAEDIWDKSILEANNYHQFTQAHLRELARLRFFPQEWPADIRALLMTLTGEQLLVLSQLEASVDISQITSLIEKNNHDYNLQLQWQKALQQAELITRHNGILLDEFSRWMGEDLALDVYRLWNADQLALRDITPRRFAQYQVLAEQFALAADRASVAGGTAQPRSLYQKKLATLLKVLLRFAGDQPADHFLLDLREGEIIIPAS